MFRDHTTFIIGAGASAEYNLPIGKELAKQIRESATVKYDKNGTRSFTDAELGYAIKTGWPEYTTEEIFYGMDRIYSAIDTSVSIDAFMHRNQDYPIVVAMGKALIAWNILKAEASSLMKPHLIPGLPEQFDRSLLTDTWIGKFMRILFDDQPNPKKLSKQVKIICFNYDRCIEYYLIESIKIAYSISDEEAYDIVADMEIIHPYGYLGKLPQGTESDNSQECPFGREVNGNTPLRVIADRIQTYTQQIKDVPLITGIQSAINDSKNLIFCGFGYNSQNLNLLRVLGSSVELNTKAKNIYACAYGFDPAISETIQRRLIHLYSDMTDAMRKVYYDAVRVICDKNCSEMFDTYNLEFSKFNRSANQIIGVGFPKIKRVDLNRSESFALDD